MSTAAEALLARETLVVDQKTKLFELRNQYRLLDENGSVVGAVEQVSQSPFTMVARVVSDLDLALPVRLEVRAADGTPVLVLHKPWFRMTLAVSRPDGTAIGSIQKKIRVGKARFVLADQAGRPVGEVQAQNWRAKDFKILDVNRQPVAEVAKQWRGVARELFTDADTYVVHVEPGATDPLRSLAIGAALAIDVIMKQKDY